MPGIKLADIKSNLFSLAVLALLFNCPAHAEESSASPQTLDAHEAPPVIPVPVWHDDTASVTGDNETTAEASHNDVWQRIRSGFGVDEAASQNPLVAVHESWFAARPENVRRLAERSRPFLYHIVEELDRRAMPMEIALLPMIESAFNPVALSSSAASGIWQFIPSTGLHYGLRQDTWYDGRRDFTAATDAALDYLGKLFLDFGDWQLALAAYNCGEGCVARAIRKNVQLGLPTDYASLTLPNETRHYVPKLLALKSLIREPEPYGIAIEQLPDQPYFNQVTVHADMDVHSAARLADMSSDEFVALNAAFLRKLIRSDTPVNLLLPVGKADTFQRNLETGSWDTWRPYAAQKGERPAAIAKRFDVSLGRLEEHNQLHTKNGKLVSAQTILVPVKGRGAITAKDGLLASAAAPTRHVVQRGDTLSGLARHYGLSMAALKSANPRLGTQVKVGQTIRLPLHAPAASETGAIQPVAYTPRIREPAQPARYTVKRGDTLLAIAQRFAISLADIKAWNPVFKKSSTIRVGQTVVISQP
ncbi:LysM peptidoglycan-binding domain-containing protein [Thiobacillus denitrificans]|uniref:Peptidoglycan-binding protein LysM n=1 Tax=Thiobacillus denitrificans TaxID=36861 RepID=A0A106BPA3_THIDE|nr:LysM peptidoglycan-binding domain-containing protein [Thiobacillus denitrificans]KVW96131.1 peptidoglycan-binding protein LysM [Thiobacillus denitrificans]